jgi:FkbM family methyltransferase
MNVVNGAVRAFRRGGPQEVLWVARKRLATRIEPAPRAKPKKSVVKVAPAPHAHLTAKARPTVPPTSAAPERLTAGQVSHAQALDWFAPRRKTYERLVGAVAPFVDPDGLVLDVGANIGYFTKVFGETLGFRGTVHLFEPIPHLAELCRTTLGEVPYTAVVHEFGLSDADAQIEIFQAADGNLGWNTIVASKASAGMQPLAIQVRAFDSCAIEGTPSFIKIDVEGAEYSVLAGMLEALESWSPRPTILCEVGWGSGHPAWAKELEIFDQLARLGYGTQNLDGQPIDVRSLTRTTDVLFVQQQGTEPGHDSSVSSTSLT